MKTFSFDTLYYGMIHTLVLQALDINYTTHFERFNTWYTYLLCIPLFISACCYYYKKLPPSPSDPNYVTINICGDQHIKNFIEYIKYNSQYYDLSVNTNIGDKDKYMEYELYNTSWDREKIKNQLESISQDVNCKVNFDDKYLDIKGFYVWGKDTKDAHSPDSNARDGLGNPKSVSKTISIKYMQFNILKSDCKLSPEDILDKVTKFIAEKQKNQIELKYIKLLQEQQRSYYHIVSFYSGTKQRFESLEVQHIGSFFHQEKDRLWSLIKNVCLNPEFYKSRGQTPRVSLLLHGPAGTGKSTLAHRIAMCFSRHIVSLDLRNCNKRDIYTMMHLPSDLCGFGRGVTHKDFVYLFEEFDLTVKEFHLREEKHKHETDD